MAQIVSAGTALPPYRIEQREIQDFSKRMFEPNFSDIDRYLPIFENTEIKARYFSKPIEWFEKCHGLKEKNDAYIKMACDLGEKAVRDCLQGTGISLKEIDHFFFVSSTGIATPSIDAHLINTLEMNQHIKRTPIWGLGCAGGVAGLSRAFEYVKAFPDKIALVLAVELCGLTFRQKDLSKSNLVATSLFGDGAAAVLVAGEKVKLSGSYPVIYSSQSTIWYQTLDVMGWNVEEDGLKVVFSRDIPTIIQEFIPAIVSEFLSEQKIHIQDITRMISHPGGKKVLEAYERALKIPRSLFQSAYEVLSEYGNMSSATVFFVLKKELQQKHTTGGWGLMSALGPGFSSELLLMKW